MRNAARAIPQVWSKTFQNGIVLLEFIQAVKDLAHRPESFLPQRSCASGRRQNPDEFEVAFEKIIVGKAARMLPGDLLELKIRRLARKFGHAIKQQGNRRAIFVADVLTI